MGTYPILRDLKLEILINYHANWTMQNNAIKIKILTE